MASINPSALAGSTTPTLSIKPLPAAASTPKLAEKRTVTAPRIDIEPLYTAVKSGVADADWLIYKTSVAQYLLGNLNQEELAQKLSAILTTPALDHAHNQLVAGIFGNATRDAPEPGVASWVSASDKVGGGAGGAKVGGGDEQEKRLKSEVMQISRRERKRLKTVRDMDIGYDSFTEMMREYHDARRIKIPDTGPASAGGFQKTNWEIEIRKRYTQPLFTETHEFPDEPTISARMLPICYEYGLPSGHTPDCPSYMNVATETFIKEALTNFFSRANSNGPGYVRTAEYKRRTEAEERKVDRGELQRTTGGLLPSELEEQRKRQPLCMEDLKVALELGDQYLGQVPMIAGHLMHAQFLDVKGIDTIGEKESKPDGILANGINGTHGNNDPSKAFTIDLGDAMAVEDDWGWSGGSVPDLEGLDSALDGCLAVGI
ncbi:hypothetical protein EJ04DRAFT_472907 [Polyplosphaeria fusca]|uniref:Transcriptional co-activator n=1 Tax=Polyplosphaeria fusca TaxID=682080 RepID=A0A9P4QTX0_9PLEO|nr:hypothetical protein EJ04DRAFT_472907 [Polyplosphaeria fusca]